MKKKLFLIKKFPNMIIYNYIKRIIKYSKPKPQSLISALIILIKYVKKKKMLL